MHMRNRTSLTHHMWNTLAPFLIIKGMKSVNGVINKNGRVLDVVDCERLVPKGGIVRKRYHFCWWSESHLKLWYTDVKRSNKAYKGNGSRIVNIKVFLCCLGPEQGFHTPCWAEKVSVGWELKFKDRQFKSSSQWMRMQGLVKGFIYIDDIAKHAQICLDHWQLMTKFIINVKHLQACQV